MILSLLVDYFIVRFKRDTFRNLDGGEFRTRNIKNTVAASGLTMNLTSHEEFECDKDTTNINKSCITKKKTLRHQKNFLNLNKNYNELLLKLLFKHTALKNFPFQFIVNAQLGSKKVFHMLPKRQYQQKLTMEMNLDDATDFGQFSQSI